jgi:hypothetical protein
MAGVAGQSRHAQKSGDERGTGVAWQKAGLKWAVVVEAEL